MHVFFDGRDRRVRRRRAGRRAGGRGLRAVRRGLDGAVTEASSMAGTGAGGLAEATGLRRRARSARTSRSWPARCTTGAAGVPRQRQHARRSRRRSSTPRPTTTRTTTPTCPRRAHAGRGGHRAYEGARDKVAAFINAPTGARSSSPRTHRGAEPARGSCSTLGRRPVRRSARATRSSSPRWSTTATWCRGSCCPAHRRDAGAGSGSTDDGRLDLSRLDEVDQRAHQGRLRSSTSPTSWAPSTRSSAIVARAHAVGALVDPRRRAVRRRTCRLDVQALGRRLRRLHRAQDARPDRRRRAVGPLRTAGRAAAVPRRRRDGRRVEMAGTTYAATAAPLRGRHPDDRRRRSGSARPSTTCTALGIGERRRATSPTSPATRWSGCRRSTG